jgi:hypothetical protein
MGHQVLSQFTQARRAQLHCWPASPTLPACAQPAARLARPPGAAQLLVAALADCWLLRDAVWPQVLAIDADSQPLLDPTTLFEDPRFRAQGT